MYYVIEGEHTDPNKYETINISTRLIHGPYDSMVEANKAAISFTQKNIDNYYHRCWIRNSKPTN